MSVMILTEHHFEFPSLKGDCTGSSGSTLVKMPHSLFGKHMSLLKELLAIRRIFSLVEMITNTKFSNCPNVFEIGVVQQ